MTDRFQTGNQCQYIRRTRDIFSRIWFHAVTLRVYTHASPCLHHTDPCNAALCHAMLCPTSCIHSSPVMPPSCLLSPFILSLVARPACMPDLEFPALTHPYPCSAMYIPMQPAKHFHKIKSCKFLCTIISCTLDIVFFNKSVSVAFV